MDGDGFNLVEAAAVGSEVRKHDNFRDLRLVRVVVLHILVPRLVNYVTKEIYNAIVGGVVEGAVVLEGCVFCLFLVEYGVWCVLGGGGVE